MCRFLWTILLCLIVSTESNATSYVYDAHGRLNAVRGDTGNATIYRYDSLGNLIAIDQVVPGTLEVFTAVPGHGATGSEVLVQGTGFAANPNENAVAFNGQSTVVMAASNGQLRVVVPPGATTGPITVTAHGATASSPSPFVVDDAGLPPEISAVSPGVVAVGDTLTVTGFRFRPVEGATTLRLGARPLKLSAVGATTASAQIAPGTSSGFVAIETPYGASKSSSPVVVVPPGMAISTIGSVTVVGIDGASVHVGSVAGGRASAVLFDGKTNDWLSIQLSGLVTSATRVSYAVYAPGNELVQQGTVSPTALSVHLPRLPVAGTYLVLITPDTASAELDFSIERNTVLKPGVSSAISATVVGQTKRVLFAGARSHSVTLAVPALSSSPIGKPTNFSIVRPDGIALTNSALTTPGALNLYQLPLDGIYQVLVTPSSGSTSLSEVLLSNAVEAVLAKDGPVLPIQTTAAGQNAYMTFAASANDYLELELTGIATAGAASDKVQLTVLGPSGVQVASYTCMASSPAGACGQHLWNLPAGNYTVIAVPTGSGTFSFNARLRTWIDGGKLQFDEPLSVSQEAGQVTRVSFDANAGDTIALQLSALATQPANQTVQVIVYRPDGGPITTTGYASATFAGPGVLNLANLPATGSYTVLVITAYLLPADATLTLRRGAVWQQAADGQVSAHAAKVAGQNVYLNIAARSGDNLELVFTDATAVGGSSDKFDVQIFSPSGALVVSYTCLASSPLGSCGANLWNLTEGNYRVIAIPTWGGRVKFNAKLEPWIDQPKIAAGGGAQISQGSGQVTRLTFDGVAGQPLTLQLLGAATNPSGQTVGVLVFRPDSLPINRTTTPLVSVSVTGDKVINVSSLPVSGIYTILVVPAYLLPTTIQINLAPQAYRVLTTDGVPQSFQAQIPGQNVVAQFNASAHDSFSFVMTSLTAPGSAGDKFDVNIYGPSGAQVTSYTCFASYPSGSCGANLWDLTSGTYSIVATPTYGGSIHFDARIQPWRLEPDFAIGQSTLIRQGAGQETLLTFEGTAGDTINLQLSEIATSPVGYAVVLNVYRPDVGSIGKTTPTFASVSTATDKQIILPNLPISGTYRILVISNYLLPANVRILATRQ